VRSCAIHQPNLLPRLSTLAKLYAADVWVVLDDVQFTRHNYQHRVRLAALDDPAHRQWLSLETHLPYGRATLIREGAACTAARNTRREIGRASPPPRREALAEEAHGGRLAQVKHGDQDPAGHFDVPGGRRTARHGGHPRVIRKPSLRP
jgi:WbqC-like protein family